MNGSVCLASDFIINKTKSPSMIRPPSPNNFEHSDTKSFHINKANTIKSPSECMCSDIPIKGFMQKYNGHM